MEREASNGTFAELLSDRLQHDIHSPHELTPTAASSRKLPLA
jgi:hypothetical protein